MPKLLTLTFSQNVENHVGNQQIGTKEHDGFTKGDLDAAKEWFTGRGIECEVISIKGPEGAAPAWILKASGGMHALVNDINALTREAFDMPFDTKALMRGSVKNKHARHNNCISDESQAPNYSLGRGTVVSFASLPYCASLRVKLPEIFGPKAENLFAESNLYYDLSKCGIGLHGDTERRLVIGVRLGDNVDTPLEYQWFKESEPIGARMRISLRPGDVYAMSEKAVGYDWKKKKVYTLRHATGSSNYVLTNEKILAKRKRD